MRDIEKLELLKAVRAVAVADGQMRRSEMGVAAGLATRVGVGKASFEAMLKAAERGDSSTADVLIRSKDDARMALELLVAEARIDGEIHDTERELLVRIADQLGITGDEFQSLYQAGIQRADTIRKRRQ